MTLDVERPRARVVDLDFAGRIRLNPDGRLRFADVPEHWPEQEVRHRNEVTAGTSRRLSGPSLLASPSKSSGRPSGRSPRPGPRAPRPRTSSTAATCGTGEARPLRFLRPLALMAASGLASLQVPRRC